LDLDSWSFRIKFREAQADNNARYVITFRRTVPTFPTFVGVDLSIDNSSNFGQFFGMPGDADVDLTDRNDGGFIVEGTFSTLPNATAAYAQVTKTGNVLTGEVSNFSVIVKLEINSADQGVNVFSILYPLDFTGIKVVSVESADTFLQLSGNNLASGLYSTTTRNSGELAITFAQAIKASKILRFNLQATMPTAPIFADFEVDIDNNSNVNPQKAELDLIDSLENLPLADRFARMGFEVKPSYSIDSLKPLVLSSTVENLIIPQGGSALVTPNSIPQMSVVFKASVDATVAGFNVVTLMAPAGFVLPQTYTVTKAATVTGLGNITNRLGSDKLVVNKDLLTSGTVKFKFLNTQDSTSLSVANGYTDGTAYYRIDFSPTAPEFESFDSVSVSLNNTANPLSFFPLWDPVATAQDLGITDANVIDTDGLMVDVVVPYNSDAKPVVDELLAEVNVATGSGNFKGAIDMSTEGTFRVDVKPVISDNTLVSGIDRIGVKIPQGFSTPSSITVVKMTLVNGVYVSANVQTETSFQADISRLGVKLKTGVDKDQEDHFYRITFKSKTFDYSSGVYFEVVVDNSSAPNVNYAAPFNVDRTANNDSLEIKVLQKALSGADFQNYFTPVADRLVLEVSPQTASVSDKAKEFSVYTLADNVTGQRGFNRLLLELPEDFANISNVKVYRSTAVTVATPDGFSQLVVGSGLSEVKVASDDPVYGNLIRADFSDLLGVGADVVIKVVFNADMPSYKSVGYFSVQVDDKSKSFPSFGFPGDASSASATNDDLVFVEPNLALVDFSKRLLSEFVAEVSAGNVITGDTVTGTRLGGQVVATKSSFVDVMIKAKKGANQGGFDYLEIFMPYPIDGSRLAVGDVRVASANVASYVGSQSFVRIDPTKLRLTKTDASVSIKFNDGALSVVDEAVYFRVRIPVLAPDESGIYEFGVRAFSTNVNFAGLESLPLVGDAVPNLGSNSFEVNVQPFIDANFNPSVFPVAFVEAEVMPNYVPAGKNAQFTLTSRVTVESFNSGYNQLKVLIPTGFGKPGSVSLKIDALDSVNALDPSTYTVTSSTLGLIITLVSDIPVTTTGNVTVSFDSLASALPSDGEMSFWVGLKTQPIQAVNAAWGDVNMAEDQGNGSLRVSVYPDFNNITFVPPVDELYGELTATNVDGTSSILTGSTARIKIYARAEFAAGNTAGGFNVMKLHLPDGFGSFPSKIEVVAGSTNLLVGTSTGFELNTSDKSNPVINFKQTYSTNIDILVTFDIQVPAYADEYLIDFDVNNAAIPFPFLPYFGFEDINGDPNDGNGLTMFVFPQPLVFDETVYVVDSLTAEVVSNDIKVNSGATVDVYAKVTNSSGNGFDRLRIRKSEDLNFTAINSVQKTDKNGIVTNFVKNVDYTVIFESYRARIIFNQIQSLGDVSDTYKVNLSLNAPVTPDEKRLDVVVDNGALSQPLFATPGNANGVDTDSNDLLLYIVPDFSALLTGGDLTVRDNLRNIFAETVIVNGSGVAKKAVVGSSNTIRVLIRPEFDVSDRGVNKFSIQVPPAFGKISKVAVFSTNVSGQTLLTKGNVDYNESISVDNRVDIDFSAAQRTTWKLLNASSTANSTVVFTVEITATMPDSSGTYRISVKADNKSVPLPKEAIAANLNDQADDDGDGFANGINDNSNFILVTPVVVSAADFAARVNASSVTSEILGTGRGQLGKTVEVSIATQVNMGTSGNINRLYYSFPKEFSNVAGLKVSRASAGTSGNLRLAEVTDYTTDLSDVSLMKIRFTSSMTSNVTLFTTFQVTLPSRSESFDVGVAVDNSFARKKVEATPGDVVPASGTDKLIITVDPAAYTSADLLKNMLTTLTAQVSSPSSMLVNQTVSANMTVTPTFATTDVGFDILNISVPGLSNIKDFVVIAKGLQDTQLFEGTNYKTIATPTGAALNFKKAFTSASNITSLQLTFKATSGSSPRAVTFVVEAASTSFPLVRPALLAPNASLSILVQPAPKTSSELKQRPARPVASLTYDVAQQSGNASSVLPVDIFIRATSAANTIVGNEEIPASSGFDSLSIDMPKTFGTASQLRVFSYSGNFSTAATELQVNSDFSYTVNKNNVVSILLLKGLMLNTGAEAAVHLKVSMSTSLPPQPQTANIFVAVNNSRNVNEVKAADAELSGDNFSNRKIFVLPLLSLVAKTIVAEAKATVVYPLDSSGNVVKADAGQTAYQYSIRLAASAIAGGIGFDILNIDMPKRFKDIKVTSLKVTRAGVSSSLANYTSELDASNRLSMRFGEIQAILGGNTEFATMEIGLVAKMPAVKKLYHHKMSLFNSAEATSMSVSPNVVLGSAAESGQLAVEVIKLSSGGQSKYGVFGALSGNVLSAFTGAVSVWDDKNTSVTTDDAFSSNIFHLPVARNVLVQTTPVMSATEDGFDYLQVDLPYGSGIPSNVVVFYKSTSGNIVYLEDFYDYQVVASASDLTVEFSSPVKASTLSTSGVFFTKLGESLAAQNLFVSFEMTMPNRLGTHFFDVFVLNTTTKSDPYYVDDATNPNKRPVVIGTVARSANEDGTRFMRVEQAGRGTVTATVADAGAEITTQDQFTNDLSKNARRTLRLDISVTPGASDTYDTIEVEMPEGFNTFSNVAFDDGSGMKQYRDYKLDLEHPRSLGVTLTTKRSSAGLFTLTFDAQTPNEIPANSVTYTFGVVIGDQEPSALSKKSVFTTAKDVTLNNGGNDLSLALNNVVSIAGSLLLQEPALGALSGKIKLSLGTEIFPEVAFSLAKGETSVPFVLTNRNSLTNSVISWPSGTYNLEVSLDQFKQVNQAITVSGTSVTNVVAVLYAEDLQASMTLSPAFLAGSQTNTALQLIVKTNVTSGNTLKTLTLALPQTGFDMFTVSAIHVGGTLLDPSQWSVTSFTLSANLGSVAAANVVIDQTITGKFPDTFRKL
jgi:hypothetical protein